MVVLSSTLQDFTSTVLDVIQLDCPSDGHWDVVVAASYLGPMSNQRPFLDSSAQTTWGNILDIFRNTQKQACLTSFCVSPQKGVFQRVFCQGFGG